MKEKSFCFFYDLVIDRKVGLRMIRLIIDWSIDWFTDRSIDYLIERLMNRWIDWLIDRFMDPVIDWLVE